MLRTLALHFLQPDHLSARSLSKGAKTKGLLETALWGCLLLKLKMFGFFGLFFCQLLIRFLICVFVGVQWIARRQGVFPWKFGARHLAGGHDHCPRWHSGGEWCSASGVGGGAMAAVLGGWGASCQWKIMGNLWSIMTSIMERWIFFSIKKTHTLPGMGWTSAFGEDVLPYFFCKDNISRW